VARRIEPITNSSDTNENQTCDVLAWTTVPQPTAPLCDQKFFNYGDEAAEIKLLRPLAGYTLYDHKQTTPYAKNYRLQAY
jgi:hypothetical protein